LLVPAAFAADRKPDTAAPKKTAQETTQSVHPRAKARTGTHSRNPATPIAPAA
jgi:hypothetical protein